MAYPAPSSPEFSHGAPTGPLIGPSTKACSGGFPQVRTSEGDHQREKLEFALAVAISRGDLERSKLLGDQIAALGLHGEEPGT